MRKSVVQLVDKAAADVASPLKLTPTARGVVVEVQGVKLIEFAVLNLNNQNHYDISFVMINTLDQNKLSMNLPSYQ